MERNRTVVQAVEKLLKRIRRLEKSVHYIDECLQNSKISIFAKIGKTARRKLQKSNVSTRNIIKMERKNLHTEKKKHAKNMMNLQSEINSKFEKIKHNCPDLKTFENLKI